ncbi:MAG: hypothetical protein ABR956_17815, partial [Terracidiphilus sp.]
GQLNDRALQAAEKLNDVSARRFCNQGPTLVGPITPVKSMLGFSPCKSWQGIHLKTDLSSAACLAPEECFPKASLKKNSRSLPHPLTNRANAAQAAPAPRQAV